MVGFGNSGNIAFEFGSMPEQEVDELFKWTVNQADDYLHYVTLNFSDFNEDNVEKNIL